MREARNEASEPAEAATAPPRFDFYESLAEFEVVVPQSSLDERAASSAQDTAPSTGIAEAYLVQAGSFRALGDADRRQASLALLGIESQIHRVNLGDEIYHRVMIGPLSERAEFNRVMRRLRDADIESLPLILTD
jgi:cell division protein FtsN